MRKLAPDEAKAHRKASAAKYRAKTRDKKAAYLAEYYRTNIDAIKTRATKYAEENPERLKAAGAKYRQTHKQKTKDRHFLYYSEHKAERQAYDAAYWALHREEHNAYLKQWRANHPSEAATYTETRRARKVHAPACDFTPKQWEELKATYKGRCAYCGRKMKRLTQDHIIPLSKGGAHTVNNIIPSCQSCNSRKATRAAPVHQPILAGYLRG